MWGINQPSSMPSFYSIAFIVYPMMRRKTQPMWHDFERNEQTAETCT